VIWSDAVVCKTGARRQQQAAATILLFTVQPVDHHALGDNHYSLARCSIEILLINIVKLVDSNMECSGGQ